MTRWNVSEPTSKKALAFLVSQGIITPRERSGYVVCDGFFPKALVLLHFLRSDKLPPPKNWKQKIASAVAPPVRAAFRLGLCFDAPSLFTRQFPDALENSQDSVVLQCMHGFFQEAREEQSTVEWFFRDGNPARDEANLKLVEEKRLQGVIFLRQQLFGPINHVLKRLNEKGVKAVTLFDSGEHAGVPGVQFNDFGMGYEAAKRLLTLGHRSFCVMAPRAGRRTFDDRVNGFYFAVQSSEIDKRSLHIECCRLPENKDAPEFLARSLRATPHPPTAVFFTGFHLATGGKAVLKKLNRSVPENLSIVTCGRDSSRDASRPKMDIFALDMEKAGREGCRQLLRLLRNEPIEKIVLLDIDYISHGSTGPAKKPEKSGRRKRQSAGRR